MKTDALFYQLFQTLPDLFFELTGLTYSKTYQFQSVELKQTAFRIDGVFMSTETKLPLIFVEVQFQKDATFYGRFFAEIMLYLYQQQPKQTTWQAVAIFPTRSTDNSSLAYYQTLLPNLQRIYLDEVLPNSQPTTLDLMAMIIANDQKAIDIAKNLLQQPSIKTQDFLISMIETILVYKLTHLTREEIWNMINLERIDITRTFLYQDALREGKRQEGKNLISRLLNKRFGQLPEQLQQKIELLSLDELEQLADEFFVFSSLDDLQRWLDNKTNH